jgi:hypothetical protein
MSIRVKEITVKDVHELALAVKSLKIEKEQLKADVEAKKKAIELEYSRAIQEIDNDLERGEAKLYKWVNILREKGIKNFKFQAVLITFKKSSKIIFEDIEKSIYKIKKVFPEDVSRYISVKETIKKSAFKDFEEKNLKRVGGVIEQNESMIIK